MKKINIYSVGFSVLSDLLNMKPFIRNQSFLMPAPNGVRYPRIARRGLAPWRHLVAQKTQRQNTLDAESSPLGEDVQRTEEVRCALC
jgi:hypothetical protein